VLKRFKLLTVLKRQEAGSPSGKYELLEKTISLMRL
jgi:hypothetical protein